jgi:MFS family permease
MGKILASFTFSALSSALLNVIFLLHVMRLAPHSGSPFLYTVSYAAMVLSGLFTGYFASRFSLLIQMRVIELVRMIGVFIYLIFNQYFALHIIFLYAFLYCLLEASFQASKYSIIAIEEQDEYARRAFIYRLQSYEGTVQILGPSFAAITFLAFNENIYAIYLVLLGFFISSIYWFFYNLNHLNDFQEKKGQHILSGYQWILANRPLLFMQIARVFTNLPLIIISIAIPTFLFLNHKDTFETLQAFFSTLMAFSLFLTNRIIPRLFQEETRERKFILLGTICTVLSMLALTLIATEAYIWAILVIPFLMGISIAGFRTPAIIIGTKLTPRPLLAQVIAAGDSLTRLSTFFIATAISFATAYLFYKIEDIIFWLSLSSSGLIFVSYIIYLQLSYFLKNADCELKPVEVAK